MNRRTTKERRLCLSKDHSFKPDDLTVKDCQNFERRRFDSKADHSQSNSFKHSRLTDRFAKKCIIYICSDLVNSCQQGTKDSSKFEAGDGHHSAVIANEMLTPWLWLSDFRLYLDK